EGDAVVHAEWAVYDPQNEQASEPFRANGSSADHLALVLNNFEAGRMAGLVAAAKRRGGGSQDGTGRGLRLDRPRHRPSVGLPHEPGVEVRLGRLLRGALRQRLD